jgi:small basic protein
MAVTSKAMGASASPHLVKKSAVIRITITLLRILAILLLLASTFGNFVQFAGGWGHVGFPRDETALKSIALAAFLACVYQSIFSVLQWGFKAQRWWALYVVALLASVVPSFLTYNAWLGPQLAIQIGLASHLVIFLTAIFADALPEWVLVE